MNRVFECKALRGTILRYLPVDQWRHVRNMWHGSELAAFDILPFRLVNRALACDILSLYFKIRTSKDVFMLPLGKEFMDRAERFPEARGSIETMDTQSASQEFLKEARGLRALIMFWGDPVPESAWPRVEHLRIMFHVDPMASLELPWDMMTQLNALTITDNRAAVFPRFPDQLTYLSVPLDILMSSGPLPQVLRTLEISFVPFHRSRTPLDLELPKSIQSLKSSRLVFMVHRDHPNLVRATNVLFKTPEGILLSKETTVTNSCLLMMHGFTNPEFPTRLDVCSDHFQLQSSMFGPKPLFSNISVLRLTRCCFESRGTRGTLTICSSSLPPCMKHLWMEHAYLEIDGPAPGLKTLCCKGLYHYSASFEVSQDWIPGPIPENLKAYVQMSKRPVKASELPASLFYLACDLLVKDWYLPEGLTCIYAAKIEDPQGNRTRTGFLNGCFPHESQMALVQFVEAREAKNLKIRA